MSKARVRALRSVDLGVAEVTCEQRAPLVFVKERK